MGWGIGESANPRNQSESKDPEPGASDSIKLNQIKQAKRLQKDKNKPHESSQARFTGVPRPSPSISSSHQTIHGRRWTETLDSLHDHDRTTLPSFQL